MGRIATELADLAIVTSDNPRSEEPEAIIAEILAGAGDAEVEPDRREAIARAVGEAADGDVVVIAGKGHEQGQQFADHTIPFDDREGRARGAPPARSSGVIPLRVDELPQLGELDAHAEVITGVQVDSRRIERGDLFVAVGRGAEFRNEALVRGAAATLLPDRPFEAFAALGSLVRDRSDARVVGITGSTGKTSTKDILAALCAPAAPTVAAEASFNNEIGVPLTLCRLEPDTQVCILELAMRGFGPDRRPLPDRAAARRRDHERRSRASRPGRLAGRRATGEEASWSRRCPWEARRRARRVPGRAGRHRGRAPGPAAVHARADAQSSTASASTSPPSTRPPTPPPRWPRSMRSASRGPSESRSSSRPGAARSCRCRAAAC
jgi:hypothetical protein